MNMSYDKLIEYISNDIKNIFNNTNINQLSDYEKRKLIFNYLNSNWIYNWKEFFRMSYEQIVNNRYWSNNVKNLYDCIVNRICLCNSISSYYMLLLKSINIDSCVVCTDNGFPIKHALNIIYDKNCNLYSFDDVSSSIIHYKNKDAFFDYDLEDANNLMQGTVPFALHNTNWLRIPNAYTYSLIDGYDDDDISIFKSFSRYEMPEIVSQKKQYK